MAEEKVKSTNLPKNTTAALCYVLGWITGLIFLLVEKEDKTIRFHALQSIGAFGALTILNMVPLVGWILTPFIMLGGFILWLILIVKTYQGEKVKLPIVGEWAEKQVGK